jgi:hypothetical protein
MLARSHSARLSDRISESVPRADTSGLAATVTTPAVLETPTISRMGVRAFIVSLRAAADVGAGA